MLIIQKILTGFKHFNNNNNNNNYTTTINNSNKHLLKWQEQKKKNNKQKKKPAKSTEKTITRNQIWTPLKKKKKINDCIDILSDKRGDDVGTAKKWKP